MSSKLPRRPLSEKNSYHLNEFREREIIYFCLQYNYWKRRAKVVVVRNSSDEWNSPTEEEALTIAQCKENMKIVEDACKTAYPEQWELLLKGVTDPDSNWNNLKLVKGLAVGRDKYYELKHHVYYLVSQKDYRV